MPHTGAGARAGDRAAAGILAMGLSALFLKAWALAGCQQGAGTQAKRGTERWAHRGPTAPPPGTAWLAGLTLSTMLIATGCRDKLRRSHMKAQTAAAEAGRVPEPKASQNSVARPRPKTSWADRATRIWGGLPLGWAASLGCLCCRASCSYTCRRTQWLPSLALASTWIRSPCIRQHPPKSYTIK